MVRRRLRGGGEGARNTAPATPLSSPSVGSPPASSSAAATTAVDANWWDAPALDVFDWDVASRRMPPLSSLARLVEVEDPDAMMGAVALGPLGIGGAGVG